MVEIRKKDQPKTRRVMMLWTDEMFNDAKEFAGKHSISVSELSRLAITEILNNHKPSK